LKIDSGSIRRLAKVPASTCKFSSAASLSFFEAEGRSSRNSKESVRTLLLRLRRSFVQAPISGQTCLERKTESTSPRCQCKTSVYNLTYCRSAISSVFRVVCPASTVPHVCRPTRTRTERSDTWCGQRAAMSLNRRLSIQPLDILCTPCCISHLAMAAESNLTQEPTRNEGILPRFARLRIVMREI
jgi:hypothetical protein